MTYGGGRGRRPSGTRAGGQFTPHTRNEGALTLIEPISEFELARMRKYLARCRNGMGKPLSDDARTRIEAFMEAPTAERWEGARTVVITEKKMMTLWQAAVGFSAFIPESDGTWISPPTREQALNALDFGTRG